MGGFGGNLNHGGSGEIIVMMKAILLFHFDIDCGVRFVHVDMAGSRSGG